MGGESDFETEMRVEHRRSEQRSYCWGWRKGVSKDKSIIEEFLFLKKCSGFPVLSSGQCGDKRSSIESGPHGLRAIGHCEIIKTEWILYSR